MEKGRPKRRTPAHPPAVSSLGRATIGFVTVCTKNRKPILARDQAYHALVRAWRRADLWLVGRYVVMPEHIHLFCSPADTGSPPVTRWTHFWRSLVSQRWPWPTEQPIWLRSVWDRQLRSGESYDQKWAYVRENPVRHGLVSDWRDWPYQGELDILLWE